MDELCAVWSSGLHTRVSLDHSLPSTRFHIAFFFYFYPFFQPFCSSLKSFIYYGFSFSLLSSHMHLCLYFIFQLLLIYIIRNLLKLDVQEKEKTEQMGQIFPLCCYLAVVVGAWVPPWLCRLYQRGSYPQQVQETLTSALGSRSLQPCDPSGTKRISDGTNGGWSYTTADSWLVDRESAAVSTRQIFSYFLTVFCSSSSSE